MLARIARLARLGLAVAPVAVAACSSADETSGPNATIPAAYTKYCSGSLKTEQKIMRSSGSGAWTGSGEKVPAGTAFLVETSFDRYAGYVIQSDGAPAKISADFEKGLVKDVDFTADCAPAKAPGLGDDNVKGVILGKASLFADTALSGTACVLDPGTALTSYSFSSGGSGAAEISSTEIKAKCGWDKAFSKDLQLGRLIAK